MVVNDADFAMLNNDNIEFVRLKKVTNIDSKDGNSTIEITVVTKDGKSTAKTVQIENEIEQNTPIAITNDDTNE
jgi:hypothetical protein